MMEKVIVEAQKNPENASTAFPASAKGAAELSKELGELAALARENRLEISELLQGAKIATTLKRYGSEPAQFTRFLDAIYTRASEKGHTTSEIVVQCEKINALEQKYGTSFEKLRLKFDTVGKDVLTKAKELKTLETEVASLQARRTKLMEQYTMDDKRLKEFSDASDQLNSMGLDIKNLVAARNCLLALKDERFDPKTVMEKLETIGLLEPRKKALQAEISKQKEQVEQNKSLLGEIKRVRDTGINIEQIERIRKVVAEISANRGIAPDQSFTLFEQDVLKNYDLSLGLIPEVARLQEHKQKILTEIEEKKAELDSKERVHQDKLSKLEERFAVRKAEIDAFNELRATGVDGSMLLRWEKLVGESELDPAELEAELSKHKSLKSLNEQEDRKLKELHGAQEALNRSLAALTADKKNLEESIKLLKDNALAQVEATRTKILSTMTELKEQAQSGLAQNASQIVAQSEKALAELSRTSQQGIKVTAEETKSEVAKALSEATTSVSGFSTGLRQALKDAEAQIKIVAETLETGEKIGKYKAILPLLEIMSEDASKVEEAEALIAMWNVSSRFDMWLSSHYGEQKKKELAEPLASLINAMNDEIQRVDNSNIQ